MQHTSAAFELELKSLGGRIAEMGGVAEKLLGDAVTALARSDDALAQTVIDGDRVLDKLQRDVEDKCILVIARRQPMASDLREVVAAMRIAGELERVGDLAKNIAKRVIALRGAIVQKRLITGVQHIAEIAAEQLKTVLDAFADRNDTAARAVRERDGEIDALHTALFRELLTYMMEDPRTISVCTHLIFCAKNVERIGDHATNIAETVHYVITGTAFEDERHKADLSAESSVDNGAP